MFKSLTAIPTESSHLFRIIGDSREMEKLKKALTVINKSVAFQVKQAEEKLKFWRIRKSAEEKTNGTASDYILNKIDECIAAIDLGKDRMKEEYFQEHNGELFIPSGFWYMVGKVEGDAHLNTEIEPYLIPGLRDYQQEIVKELLKYKRATGVLATGLGKTRSMASVALSAVNAGKRVIIVVPTEYLVGQVYDTIKLFHESVTSASSQRHIKLGQDILVTTAQSAIKHVDMYDVIQIDEGHHSPASTWQNLIMAADKAEYIYNFTATAFRADGLDLGIHALGGPVVFERNVKWGIEKGWLVKPKVYCIKVDTRKIVSKNALQTSAYKQLVNNKNVFCVLKDQLVKAVGKGRKCMVLFKTLKVAENFKKYCEKDLEFKVANANFKKPLEDFREGRSMVLVATDRLVSEGIDISDCSAIFILTQHSSDVISYQSVGRALRPAPDKKDAIVVDIEVTGYDRFENSARKRLKVYQAITDEIVKIGHGGKK